MTPPRDIHELPRFDDPDRVFMVENRTGPLPRFVLTKDVIDAMTYDEAIATLEALQECGVLKLPYPRFWLSFNFRDYALADGWGEKLDNCEDIRVTAEICDKKFAVIDREVLATLGQYMTQVHGPTGGILITDLLYARVGVLDRATGHVRPVNNIGGLNIKEMCEQAAQGAICMAGLLVAALATKNIKKRTLFNRRAVRGIGNGDLRGEDGVVYLSRTILEAPEEYDTTGHRVKFHLRRGHVHTFLTGAGRTTPIKKFLDPILVNRDLQENTVAPRKYAVR